MRIILKGGRRNLKGIDRSGAGHGGTFGPSVGSVNNGYYSLSVHQCKYWRGQNYYNGSLLLSSTKFLGLEGRKKVV